MPAQKIKRRTRKTTRELVTGDKRKQVTVRTKTGRVKKTKEKYTGGPTRTKSVKKALGRKTKTKYNPDGSVKKVVVRSGGKRTVVKKKRDIRKTITNKIRNERDKARAKRKSKTKTKSTRGGQGRAPYIRG